MRFIVLCLAELNKTKLVQHNNIFNLVVFFGAHGMRAHNNTKPADHHVRHSIPPPLNHNLLITHKFSSVTRSVSLVASVAEGDNVFMEVFPAC